MLSKSQIDTFNQEGCLCIPNFLTQEETKLLLSRSKQLLDELDLSAHPKTQFKTGENDHVGDNYFFDSSDKVSYFFDTDAFDDKGELKYPKEQAINKIGHGLHLHDEVFSKITFDEKVVGIAKSLEYVDPRVLQSMCIFKQPMKQEDEGDESVERENLVPVHTDGTFLFTEPHSALGFWYALEDCTLENGCLWYNPGTHKTFPITKRFVKIDGGEGGTNFIPVDTYDKGLEPIPEDKPEDYKSIECKAGSLVLIHNSVLHKSDKNRSKKSRFIYAFHLIDGKSKYDALNWLQVPPGKSGGTEFTKLYKEVSV
ncbi:hypothetical protein CLIB1423_01S04038 [[Candida] railenensis]|uniref:Phytanoyl-CoA dioxygenase n=1 Tax=[Candida] railenensis TaxID=45579 RepID=A0A9P0QKL0_9ASCO|nr:hypothetical protein CLIB1423_01S04038 [[Candida] railenensis]